MARHADHECCTLPDAPAEGADRAAVQFHELPCDGEAEAEPAMTASQVGVTSTTVPSMRAPSGVCCTCPV